MKIHGVIWKKSQEVGFLSKSVYHTIGDNVINYKNPEYVPITCIDLHQNVSGDSK